MRVSRSEPGFVVSSVAHAGLLLAALVVLSEPAQFEDVIETPVDVVTETAPNRVTKGEKPATEKPQRTRIDKAAKDSVRKPHPPLAEAKKDTSAPTPPLRRIADPGEDDASPKPPRRIAGLPLQTESTPELKKSDPSKPELKKAEPKPEPKPAPPVKAKAAPGKEEDEPKEAEIVKPKPPTKPKDEPAREPPKPGKTAKEAPKLDKDAVMDLLKEAAAKDAAKPAPEKPKAESRLKADEVAKLLSARKADDKSSDGGLADKSEKGSRPKSGDESAPKSKFDASGISKLLSREAPEHTGSTGERRQAAARGAPTGAAPQLSPSMEARIASYIHDHYHPCWASALSLGGATFAPVVEFHLSRDGALEGSPKLVNGSGDPVERARGEQAVQAVRRCSPMRIPPEFAPYYEEALRDVTIRFQDAN